jgi:hypothetical protein
MGFNKRYLPELDELKKIHQECPSDEDFIKRIVGKSDCLLGPSESHEYLEKIYEGIKNSKDIAKND